MPDSDLHTGAPAARWFIMPAEHNSYCVTFCKLQEHEGGPAPKEVCALTEHMIATAEGVASSRAVSRGEAIYLVPSFVTHAECDELMTAAAQYDPSSSLPKQRIPVTKLPAVFGLCDELIRRTNTLLGEQLPHLAQSLFGQTVGLSDMDISFSLHEPAINVYSAGGEFAQHEDNHMITVLVPLAEAEAFSGGGTAFWPNMFNPGGSTSFTTGHSDDSDAQEEDELLHVRETKGDGLILLPTRGTAMLFVGSVTHAGVSVDSGVRMVWVASFNLRPWKPGFSPMPGRLLVGNMRAGASNMAQALEAESPFAMAPTFGPPVDIEDHVYGGLRSDLRVDLASAAAAAASELSGGQRDTDSYEGLLDTLLESRDRIAYRMASLQGSRMISEIDQVVGPAPEECILLSASGLSAAERVTAEEVADHGG